MEKELEAFFESQKGLKELLLSVVMDDFICPICNSSLEMDNPICKCGWINRLISEGVI